MKTMPYKLGDDNLGLFLSRCWHKSKLVGSNTNGIVQVYWPMVDPSLTISNYAVWYHRPQRVKFSGLRR